MTLDIKSIIQSIGKKNTINIVAETNFNNKSCNKTLFQSLFPVKDIINEVILVQTFAQTTIAKAFSKLTCKPDKSVMVNIIVA
jgi:hypothetical protein